MNKDIINLLGNFSEMGLNTLSKYRERIESLEQENKHLLDLQKNMDKQYEKLEQENKKLKKWDNNKDSRNSRQRVANKKLLKKNDVLEYNWNELKKWLEGYIQSYENRMMLPFGDVIKLGKEKMILNNVLERMQELEEGGNDAKIN